MSKRFQKFKSPLGPLVLVADDQHLLAVIFLRQWKIFVEKFGDISEGSNPVLRQAARQLGDYFAGRRTSFDVPLKPAGTAFQRKAWQALARIPFGKVITYRQQASLLGDPKACRAIGRANGLNPLCIIRPCHRVIGSNGKLTGYAGGLRAKEFLLRLEGFSGPFKN